MTAPTPAQMAHILAEILRLVAVYKAQRAQLEPAVRPQALTDEQLADWLADATRHQITQLAAEATQLQADADTLLARWRS